MASYGVKGKEKVSKYNLYINGKLARKGEGALPEIEIPEGATLRREPEFHPHPVWFIFRSGKWDGPFSPAAFLDEEGNRREDPVGGKLEWEKRPYEWSLSVDGSGSVT